MEIIQTELRYVTPNRSLGTALIRGDTLRRLKYIEWVEKKLEALRKIFKGATGTANLADKAKKFEIVSLALFLGGVADEIDLGRKCRIRLSRFSTSSRCRTRTSERLSGTTRRSVVFDHAFAYGEVDDFVSSSI